MRTCLAVLFCLLLCTGPGQANVYYDLDFEQTRLSAEVVHEDGKRFGLRVEGGAARPQLAPDPADSDTALVLRAHPTPQGARADRAELGLTSSIRFGQRYALAMQVLRPSGALVAQGRWHLFMQCHQAGTQVSPPLSLNLEPEGRFSVVARNDADGYERLWSGPMPANRWMDLVLEFTMGAPGEVRLWVDGRRVLSARPTLRWQEGEPRCSLKTGLYRGPSKAPFEMWFDDIRLGDSYRDVIR